MNKSVLTCLPLLAMLTAPVYGQVIINEFYSGTPDYWELLNTGAAPVDVSGWTVQTFYASSAVNPGPDTTFVIPAGTILPPDGFLVGQDSTTGTGGNILYVGANIFFISGYAMEVVLFDGGGVPQDYVYADSYGIGPSTNQPAGIPWNGTVASPAGNDGHYRTNKIDTDNGSDWTNGTSSTKGSNNPGQGPQPPITGVIINEFYTGAVPAVELYNKTSASIDLSNFVLNSYSDMLGSGLVADPPFTIPSGTSIAANGFLVLEAGGTAGMPGTYPSSIYTGVNWTWNGTTSVELALLDNQGVFAQGVDYVFYDDFGTVPGAGPNLPSPTAWTGDFDTGVGDTHERVTVGDTDTAADWAKNVNPHSLGAYNPPQITAVPGIVFNEFNTGAVDWLELLNTSASPVDVTGYQINTWWKSGTSWLSNGALLSIPTIPAIPAGGVVVLVEGGTAGAAGPYPSSYYTGQTWAWISADEFEAVLYGPAGIIPLDYIVSGQSENPQLYPPAHKPATLNFDGTQVCVGNVAADIIERLTLVDRDNANDWVRQGVAGTTETPGALNPVQSLPCNAYYSQYGPGCDSSNGSPVLFGTGCPTPGASITIEMVFAPAAVPGLFVIGIGNTSLALTACCNLQVNPVINPQIALSLPTTTLTLPATIPVTVPTPIDAYCQMLFADPANPCGISSTNPLQIHFQ